MSYYTTPRRKHSSLFDRMENQIKKISKKLSAAKQCYTTSCLKPKPNQKHFTSYNSMQDRNPPTVRKQIQPTDLTQQVRSSTMHLRRRNPNSNTPTTYTTPAPPKNIPTHHTHTHIHNYHQDQHHSLHHNHQSINLDETYNLHGGASNNRFILRLQEENAKLHWQLGKLEQICEDQSYKLGYMKAELKETSRQAELQKEREFKQNCYLTSLLDHYKKKADKYKKIVNHSSEISIDLGSENHS